MTKYEECLITRHFAHELYRPEQLTEVIKLWDTLDRICEHSHRPSEMKDKYMKLRNIDVISCPMMDLAIEIFEFHRDCRILHSYWSIFNVGDDIAYLKMIPELWDKDVHYLRLTVKQLIDDLRIDNPFHLFADLAKLCTAAAILVKNINLRSQLVESYNFRMLKYAKSLNIKPSKFKTEFPYLEPFYNNNYEDIEINHLFNVMSNVCSGMLVAIDQKKFQDLITKSYELIDYSNSILAEVEQTVYLNQRFLDNLAFTIEQCKQNGGIKFIQLEVKELHKALAAADEYKMLDCNLRHLIDNVYRVAYLIIDYFYKG